MRRKSKRHSLLDELEMRWEDEQKLNGLSSVHSMGFRQFIFYLAHKVDFIAEIFLCTMILFGNVGAQPAASFLLKFASLQSSLSNRKAFVVSAPIKSSTSFLVTLPFSSVY